MSKSRGWRGDLRQSADAFERVVYPEIADEIGVGGGELLSVERADPDDPESQRVIEMLDSYAGIDYLHKDSDGIVRGIASRVQRSVDYGSFTVRLKRESHKPTEFGKRLKSIEFGGLYPQITSQAYVRDGELVNVGLCRTQGLINYIVNGEINTHYLLNQVDENGEAHFVVVFWEDYARYTDSYLYVHSEKEYHRSAEELAPA